MSRDRQRVHSKKAQIEIENYMVVIDCFISHNKHEELTWSMVTTTKKKKKRREHTHFSQLVSKRNLGMFKYYLTHV